MKRVGIITHYYRNLNYGGSLQAYALCRVLREMDVDAEQISYDMFYCQPSRSFIRRLKDAVRKTQATIRYFPFNNGWNKRRKSFYLFQEQIPHSAKIYNRYTVSEAASCYDVFVTGSDQVWNTQWYHPAFFLTFVTDNKKKIAFAASLGTTMLDEQTRDIFTQSLKDFSAISVREEDAVDMVAQCTKVPVVQTLDPTMLLSVQQWDALCAEPMVKEKYLFCFLLGDGKTERQTVRRFADQTGLKVVALPHFPCSFRKEDCGFADYSLYDVSPAQFISLIKHAQYVFTDSFHATVFSNLYEKAYFVFERNGAKNMRSRIVSLLAFYGSEDRFLDRPEKLECAYMMHVKETDFPAARAKLQTERDMSLAFLRKNVVEE